MGTAQWHKSPSAFWRCQYHGMTTKNSSRGGVEPARVWKTCVCCRGWSWKNDPGPWEEPRRLVM